jgi:hypothetical protein
MFQYKSTILRETFLRLIYINRTYFGNWKLKKIITRQFLMGKNVLQLLTTTYIPTWGIIVVLIMLTTVFKIYFICEWSKDFDHARSLAWVLYKSFLALTLFVQNTFLFVDNLTILIFQQLLYILLWTNDWGAWTRILHQIRSLRRW